jgi:hypothetical protein
MVLPAIEEDKQTDAQIGRKKKTSKDKAKRKQSKKSRKQNRKKK